MLIVQSIVKLGTQCCNVPTISYNKLHIISKQAVIAVVLLPQVSTLGEFFYNEVIYGKG